MTLLAAACFLLLIPFAAGWVRLCEWWDRHTEVPSDLDVAAAVRRERSRWCPVCNDLLSAHDDAACRRQARREEMA